MSSVSRRSIGWRPAAHVRIWLFRLLGGLLIAQEVLKLGCEELCPLGDLACCIA